MARFVTLVNRTNKTLRGTWDGKRFDLEPGKHQFLRTQAEAFKRQNPVMGTGLWGDVETQYLCGIVEDGDPIDAIEQSHEIEAYNRAVRGGAVPVVVVPGNGLFSRRDQSPLPTPNEITGGGFTPA